MGSKNIIKVFLASPSDVAPERKKVGNIIKEVNALYDEFTDIEFKIVNWETSVPAAIGKDAQAVINEYIEDDYKVLIGILWGRMGTPTPRGISGTAEEIMNAIRRYESGEYVDIKIYCKKNPIQVDAIDPDQIKKLREFVDDIRNNHGVLTHDFSKSKDFEERLRRELGKALKKLIDNGEIGQIPPKNDARLKVIESAVNRMSKNLRAFSDILAKQTEIINEVGGRLKEEQTSFKIINDKYLAEKPKDKEEFRRVTEKIEEELNGMYGSEIDPVISATKRYKENAAKAHKLFNTALLIAFGIDNGVIRNSIAKNGEAIRYKTGRQLEAMNINIQRIEALEEYLNKIERECVVVRRYISVYRELINAFLEEYITTTSDFNLINNYLYDNKYYGNQQKNGATTTTPKSSNVGN